MPTPENAPETGPGSSPETSPSSGPVTGSANAASPAAEEPTGLRAWAAVLALAIGIFVLITIEELPIAVLSVMAPDLGVSSGIGGLTVTLPGVLAGLVALATPVITRGLDRRLVLVIALVAVVLSCGLSVIAPGILVLLAARVFAGVAIGMYWAVLPVVAVRQVPAARSAQALTLAFSGVGGALVLGVPLASWIGANLGWRASFAVVGGLSLLVLALVLVLVRPVRGRTAGGLAGLRAVLRHPGVMVAVLLTAIIVTGQFVSYSYVSPMLVHLAAVPPARIGALLLAFGISGLIGNFAVAPLLRRSPGFAVLLIAFGIGLSLVAFALLVHGMVGAAVVMPLWGLFSGAASVAIQSFVTAEAGEQEEAATALNSAMYNVAIALGALVGGRIVDGAGEPAALRVSIVMMAIGAAVAAGWLLYARRPRTQM